jgi:hypothetical protein
VTLKIPQGGHSVVAGVTAATLTLVGAAALTVVLETPLTQALAAEPAVRNAPIIRRSHHAHPGAAAAPVATLARGACDRWMTNHASAIEPGGAPAATPALLTSAAIAPTAGVASLSSLSSVPPVSPVASVTPIASTSSLDPGVIFADQKCQVDELVVSRDWVVARLTVRGASADSGDVARAADSSAVEVLHLTNGQIDEDWRLADERDR